MVEDRSQTRIMRERMQGLSANERLTLIADEAQNWRLPTSYSGRSIRAAYRRSHYPIELTYELRRSEEIDIQQPFDTSSLSENIELFCELFAGAFLAPCLILEECVHEGDTIERMATMYGIPEDNVSLRLIQYYMVRFSPIAEVREYLKGIEKLGFTLFAESYEQVNGDVGLKAYL